MATHVKTCTPSTGWEWLMQGLRLFKQKPGELFLFGNTYLFIILFVGMLIPYLGAAIVTLATPALGYGIMTAGRMAQKGMRVGPAVMFTAFTQAERAKLNHFLVLGGIYTAGFAIIKLIAHLFLGPQPEATLGDLQGGNPEASAALFEYVVMYMVVVGVLSLPILLAFWYAPVLVGWHNMKPVQALFSSWVAVWRNKTTFLIYGMGWLILSLGFSSVFLTLFTMLGLPAPILSALNMLAVAIVMAVSLCTLYPTYQSVFEQDPHLDELV
ncbi:BPSS1780 family membrane protein [Limnobacter sp.]|uniref:BPSS1780 family membrane protein n=1 Tax=Limnobacter sp. TaxID=2003368 RepID=UPI0035186FE6